MSGRRLFVFVVVLLTASSVISLGTPAAVAGGENRAQAGEMAPSFSLRTLENRGVALDDYQGKVLLLEFFASWCHVCEDTAPELGHVRDNFSHENLAMLSVESDPAVPIENVRSFKSEHGGDWPFAKAPSVADRYGVEGYPTIFVVDPDGYIAFRSDGAAPPDVLNSIVADLLGTSRPGENQPENQVEITNVIIDVGVEPENAGGIVAMNLKIKKNGAPLFTYEAEANPGYEFEGWAGKEIPENRENSPTLEIVPSPGTRVTAKFAPLENIPGGAEEEAAAGPFTLVPLALGAVVAGSLGVLGGYLAWGRSEAEEGE